MSKETRKDILNQWELGLELYMVLVKYLKNVLMIVLLSDQINLLYKYLHTSLQRF